MRRAFPFQLVGQAFWPVRLASALRRVFAALVFLSFSAPTGAGLWGIPGPAAPQRVVDRIVARVQDDILMLSELRELGRYQQLVQDQAASDDRLLAQLLEQWIVNAEATAARFPRPSEAEVSRELERLEKQFASPEAYRARLQQLELSPAAVRRLLEQQLYLTRYLDYKFRPTSQVDTPEIEKYYREQLVPSLAARGQAAPPLENVQDQIRELLIQREISRRAARWLEETRSRLRIELQLGEGAP